MCDDGRARRRKDDRRPSVDGVGANGAEFYDIANVADLLQGRARGDQGRGGDVYRYSCNRLGEMHAVYRESRATQPILLLMTSVI